MDSPTPIIPDRAPEDTAGRQALADALQVSFRLLRWMMILMVGAYLISGIFIVRQHEKALVLVFGKVQGVGQDRIKEPGIHWTWPKPFAVVVPVPTERVQTIRSDSFMFAMMPGMSPNQMPPPPLTLNPAEDGYSVTADANLLHTLWALRYTIEDPEAFVFGLADLPVLLRDELPTGVPLLLRNELDHAVVKVSAQFEIDRALKTGIDAFRAAVEREVRSRLADLDVGVRVQGLEIEAIGPPRQVLDAFAKVTSMEQTQDQMISAARQYAVSVANEAKGEQERILSEGRAARQEYVSSLEASANYLQEVRDKYRAQPYVVSLTLLQDSLVRILPNLDGQHVIPEPPETGMRELRMILSPALDDPLSWDGED